MNKEVISNKQGISMMILFICGSSLIFPTAAEAKADLWLALILALLAGFITVIMYCRILVLFPRKDFFQIIEIIFGKFIGKVFCLLYIWFSFYLSALVIMNFGHFINVVGLRYTPVKIIVISIGILVIWAAKEGVEVLGRWSESFVIVMFCLVILLIPVAAFLIDINNLKPFLYDGIKPVIGAAFSTYTYPFAETIVFMSLFDSLSERKKCYKVYIIGLLLGGAIIFTKSVFDMLILGENIYLQQYFTSYAAVSRINIKEFITRIEIIVSTLFLIGGFVKVSVCLLTCCKDAARCFNFKDYRFLVTPIGILSVIIAQSNFKGIMDMAEWGVKIFPWYAVVFQLFIPIIILIGAEFKVRKFLET